MLVTMELVINSFERDQLTKGSLILAFKSLKARYPDQTMNDLVFFLRSKREELSPLCKQHSISPMQTLTGWQCDKCGTRFLET